MAGKYGRGGEQGKEEARNRVKDKENRTLDNVTGGALPQAQTLGIILAKPGPSVYGSLKSAKKGRGIVVSTSGLKQRYTHSTNNGACRYQ